MKYLERWPFLSAFFLVALILTIFLNLITPSEVVPKFSEINNIKERKQVFFNFINKTVKVINQSITDDRKKLLEIKDKKQLSKSELYFLKNLAEDYYLTEQQQTTNQLIIKFLLIKVDILPPALVLAQAANESAWGTSRFARKANNYFGIWCYTKGCGLVPKQRNKGQIHEVKYFHTVKQSIAYYMKLLNSSKNYHQLRSVRSKLYQQEQTVTASNLLPTLVNYSERGADYLKDLSALISYNKLEEKYPSSISIN